MCVYIYIFVCPLSLSFNTPSTFLLILLSASVCLQEALAHMADGPMKLHLRLFSTKTPSEVIAVFIFTHEVLCAGSNVGLFL